MPRQVVFIVRIWRSRALSGWQWAARLDDLAGGMSQRFSDPEAFLAHLRALISAVDRPPATAGAAEKLPADADAGERSAERPLPPRPDGLAAEREG